MKILIGILAILSFSGAAWAGNFTDNQNGTVTDNVTGLMWQQQDDGTTRLWDAAISYCEGLSLAGHENWRLPNIKELESITDDSLDIPAIDTTAFPSTVASDYWSSTTHAFNSNFAWFVGFGIGYVGYLDKNNNTLYARCVRGGQ